RGSTTSWRTATTSISRRRSRRSSSRSRLPSSASGSPTTPSTRSTPCCGRSGLDPRGRPATQRRLRQLTLEPQSRDPGAREAEALLVHEVARLPAREELRVEPVEPLDLEPRVADDERAADGLLGDVARLADEACERREVQGRLADAASAQVLDRFDDQELRE